MVAYGELIEWITPLLFETQHTWLQRLFIRLNPVQPIAPKNPTAKPLLAKIEVAVVEFNIGTAY